MFLTRSKNGSHSTVRTNSSLNFLSIGRAVCVGNMLSSLCPLKWLNLKRMKGGGKRTPCAVTKFTDLTRPDPTRQSTRPSVCLSVCVWTGKHGGGGTVATLHAHAAVPVRPEIFRRYRRAWRRRRRSRLSRRARTYAGRPPEFARQTPPYRDPPPSVDGTLYPPPQSPPPTAKEICATKHNVTQSRAPYRRGRREPLRWQTCEGGGGGTRRVAADSAGVSRFIITSRPTTGGAGIVEKAGVVPNKT